MTKSVLMHCGFPKTGTTTIQNFLYNHRESLEENRILYPKSKYTKVNQRSYLPAIIPNMITNTSLWMQMAQYGDVAKLAHEQWNEMQNAFKKGNFSRLILSFEGFLWDGSEEKYKRLINYFETIQIHNINAIIYVRNPITGFQSKFLQNIRGGTNPLFFLNAPKINRLRMQKLKQLNNFCDGNLTIRPFDQHQYINRDLLDDFIFHADLPNKVLDKARENYNVSNLSSEAVVLLWQHNLQFDVRPESMDELKRTRRYLRKLANADEKLGHGTKFSFNSRYMKYLQHESSNYISELDSEFNIYFSDVDYSQLGNKHEKPDIRSAEDLFSFSEVRFNELSAIIEKELD